MSDKKIIAVFGATGAQGGGLVRAILADTNSPYTVRAITRDVNSERAKALAALGADVVAADTDKPETLATALAGAYGAFCVTNFWEHGDAEREGKQATAMARATKAAGVQHAVWSTLEDVRKWIPLSDTRLPTLHGRYKCPHFDSKGVVDEIFATEGAPTSYLMAAFYWDNFIHFGMGPRAGEDGNLVLALPLGGAVLPGIAASDIGACAYGIFKKGPSAAGHRFGISGENLTGPQMAEQMGKALGKPVHFYDVPFDTYRGFGFPGAEDLGNMFQFQQILGEEFLRYRDPVVSHALNPALQDFNAWLSANVSKIAIG